MTRLFRWSASAVLAFAAVPAQAQTGFEGVATFITRSEHGAKVDTVYQTTKGRSIRMDGLGSRESGGVISGPRGAAIKLGLKRTTLQSKMRKLGISRQGLAG